MKAEIDDEGENEGVLVIQPETEAELDQLEAWIKRNIVIKDKQYRYAHKGELEFRLRLPRDKQEVKV